MEQDRWGVFRRFIQSPFSSMLPITTAISQGDKGSEAFIRHLMREAREKEAWDTPLVNTHFLVVDTETTGFNTETDSLLSIGAVEMYGPEIATDRIFHSLIRPESFQTIPPAIVELTGICEDDVAEAPSLANVLQQFLDLAKGAVLVMHHAGHDLCFLNDALWKKYRVRLSHHVIDTFDVARWIHESKHHYTLDELLRNYEITVVGRHTAEGDAKMTALLWQRMLEQIVQKETHTLGDLFEQIVLAKRMNLHP